MLFLLVIFSGSFVILDFLVISLFSLFVMEGVLALSGLVILVSFTGSDYVRSFRFIQF